MRRSAFDRTASMSSDHEVDRQVALAIPASEAVFVAKAAHELRGAVGGIEILATALADRVGALSHDDELSLLLRQLAAQSARVESMAHQLLDLTRFGEGRNLPRRTPVNVAELVDAVIDAEAVATTHSIVVDVADDLTIETDPLAFEQIVANLVRNARHHGGSTIALRGRVRDGRLVLRVADDGRGVPDHVRERLFEPFVRSSFVGGNGLGLAIVAELAGALRGHVGYEPNEPTGACFSVTLPLD
jgi:signal transduction histidine kinase